MDNRDRYNWSQTTNESYRTGRIGKKDIPERTKWTDWTLRWREANKYLEAKKHPSYIVRILCSMGKIVPTKVHERCGVWYKIVVEAAPHFLRGRRCNGKGNGGVALAAARPAARTSTEEDCEVWNHLSPWQDMALRVQTRIRPWSKCTVL